MKNLTKILGVLITLSVITQWFYVAHQIIIGNGNEIAPHWLVNWVLINFVGGVVVLILYLLYHEK